MRISSLRSFAQWTVGTCIVLYTLLVFALNNSRVQNELGRIVKHELEQILHTEVNIGRVEVGLLNSVSLHKVMLKDQSGKLLLNSDLISAKIQVRSLLRGKIFLRNIALLDTEVHLYKASKNQPTNLQFIIDAFSSKDKTSSGNTDLRINALIVRRGQLTYDEWYHPRPVSGRFSPHHIRLTDIDANLTLKHFTRDSLNFRIRQLAAREACGWDLRRLSMRFEGNRRHCTLRDVELRTPHSFINQEELEANYNLDTSGSWISTLSAHWEATNWRISTTDFSPIVPRPLTFRENFRLNGRIAYTPRRINVQQLTIVGLRHRFHLGSDATLQFKAGRPELVTAQIHKLSVPQSFLQPVLGFALKDVPPIISKLGDLSLVGRGHYHFSDHNASFTGRLQSAPGELKADLRYTNRELRGTLSSNDLRPSLLSEHKYVPGLLHFEARGQVRFTTGRIPDGQVELTVRDAAIETHRFRDVKLELTHKNGLADLKLDSRNLGADFTAQISSQLTAKGQPTTADLQFDVRHFTPALFGLNVNGLTGSVDAQLKASLPSLNIQHPLGEVLLTNLNITPERSNTPAYHLDRLFLTAQNHPKGSHLRLQSDFADAVFTGQMDLAQLQKSLNQWLQTVAAPDNASPTVAHATTGNSFALTVKRTDVLRHFFDLDVHLPRPAVINGSLATDGSFMRLSADVPEVTLNDNRFEALSLSARSDGNRLSLLAKACRPLRDAALQVELHTTAKNGEWSNNLLWDERRNHSFYGNILTTGQFRIPTLGSGRRIQFDFDLRPTTFHINGNTWDIEPGNIALTDREFAIRHVALRHADQHLTVHGTYTRGGEGIALDLQKVDVGSLLALTGLEVVRFAGSASGRAIIKPDERNVPRLSAFLDIPGFRFNDTHLGHARIRGSFETDAQTIRLQANMTEGTIGQTNVTGYVSLGHKDLDLRVEGENTPLGFLNHYISDIFHNIRGRSSGSCRIFGGFKQIDFEGRQRANAAARLPINGVTYHLNNADVQITPGSFRLNDAILTDSIRGSGRIHGVINHRHLHDMHYDFAMSGHNMLLYDRPQEEDLPFYATAYGTGAVSLKGAPGRLDVNLKMRTEPGSILTYVLDRPDNSDTRLLTFRDASQKSATSSDSASVLSQIDNTGSTDIRLNMQVEVDPSGTLRMITDKKSGDLITVHGTGPIQATYYNKGDFQMFGTYTVQRGTYDLSIQNLIKKSFTLHQGGTVAFTGNPLNADVNILANYLVTSASLADLNIGGNFSNNSIPVNCLIKFTGKMSNMNLALDFDLPNVSDDEKMMVHNLIASDEERTTQVLYLLSMGRFFTYNYNSTLAAANQSQSAVMMQSLLAGTLSSQLNSIIANAVGNSNWSFGANVSPGQQGWNNMEVDGQLSGRLLDNRLLFNGKVGYHEREAATTNFVGDFDVQYLLNPRGTWSLKAYSETNTRYFSRTSLTTQGLGIQFKHDFDSFFEFMRRKRKAARTPSSLSPR